jgi:predicted porin
MSMNRLCVIPLSRIALALLAISGVAQAADLPTIKGPPAPAPNCYASFWTWLNSSASDCPLSAYGFTLYGTLDVGYGYEEWGAPWSPSADKLNYGIRSNAYEHIWQASYNGLSTSVVGLRMNQSLAPLGLGGWSLIGLLEAGANPYSGMLYNGPRSLADANTTSSTGMTSVTIGKTTYHQYYAFQRTNLDSSRAGQWDNSQGYLGVSSPTWGALTFGRTNSLTYDSQSLYDPMAASFAFSLLGFSSSFPGYGDTEIIRINTALTYKVAIQNVAGVFNTVRLAGQAQIGGYGVGNGSMAHYEGQVGFDLGNFSFDGILAWAKDAASLSTFNGSFTACNSAGAYGISVNGACYNPDNVLKATLSNIFGAELMASYKWDRFKFYGGYLYAQQSNPSDGFSGGFRTIYPDIIVPPTSVTSTAYLLPGGTLNAPGFAFDKKLQTVWTGVRYSVPNDWLHGWGALDLAAGFYYQSQNNYNFAWTTGKTKGIPFGYATAAACTGAGAFISSSKCAGSQDGISFLADWRPVKRVDIYAGVMLTNVYGGLANGFYSTFPVVVNGKVVTSYNVAHTQSYDPTIGIRIRF